VAETSAACIIPSKKLTAQYIWKRALHTPNDRLHEGVSSKDSKSPKDDEHSQKVQKTDDHSPPQSSPSNASPDSPPSTSSSTPPHRHHLMDHLPHMPHLHRPTKEELLAAATGFWSRLKVRFKWFSIRSVRPFNLDEITALFSWVLLGHVVWVVVGTTTFLSLLILSINTVFAQGMLPMFKFSDTKLGANYDNRNTCRMGG
jgi:distribution and morphology protein 31